MNNILLTLFGMLLLAGMMGCTAGSAITTHSEEIASVADEIANFIHQHNP